MDHLTSHYKKISSEYDIYYTPHFEVVTSFILDNVSFSPDDRVVDLGGGTGGVSHLLWKRAGLKSPVLCVDPSEDMLEIAKWKEGVKTQNATAGVYLKNETETKFDKILVLACAHHFEDLRFVFENITKCLSNSGVCVYGNYSKEVSLPFFKQAKQLELSNLNTHKFGEILDLIQSVGLKTTVVHTSGVHRVSKELWFNALRKRMYSVLERLSDEEIEDGILELCEEHKEEWIDLEFKWDFILAKKEIA